MKQKITAADRVKFEQYLRKWQRILNLNNWRLEPGTGTAKAGIMAQVMISFEDHLATWHLGKSFGSTPINDFTLEQTALHELCHLFLEDLKQAVKSENETFILAAEHSITSVLEEQLLKDHTCSGSVPSISALPESPALPLQCSGSGCTSGT